MPAPGNVMNPLELGRALQRRCEEEAGVSLTAHARERMTEMAVTLEQVAEIVRDGSSWPVGELEGDGRGLLRHLPGDLGHLALICAPEQPERVITVVYWSPDERVGR